MAHEPRRWNETKETPWNTISVVHAGELFPLFAPTRNGTTIRYDDDGLFGGIASRIRLQTRILTSTLNLSIVATPYALPRAAVITPFDAGLGYPLDQEDFSWRSRYKKIMALKSELASLVHGLGLVVFVAYEDGNVEYEQDRNTSASDITLLLRRVFLTLTFPNGSSFTTQAVSRSTVGKRYDTSILLFRTFFPTDTGPLPVGDPLPIELKSLQVAEGFQILLPFNKDLVQTLQAKFLVLPFVDVG